MSTKDTKQSHTGTALLVAGLAVAGAAAGYFLYGPDGKENRKKIKSWSLKAKAEVLERLEKAKEVSEETYTKIVDEVTARYENKKGVEAGDIDKLKKELKKYWKNIQSEFASPKKASKSKKESSTTPRTRMRS